MEKMCIYLSFFLSLFSLFIFKFTVEGLHLGGLENTEQRYSLAYKLQTC